MVPKGLGYSFVIVRTPKVREAIEMAVKKSDGASSVHVLENSGHWVHVDNPDGLQHLLMGFIHEMSLGSSSEI